MRKRVWPIAAEFGRISDIMAKSLMLSKKKKRVIEIIFDQVTPISIHEIMTQLSSQPSERALRRWLHDLHKDDLIEKVGNKRGSKYQVKKLAPLSGKSSYRPESQKALSAVNRPLRERMPVSYIRSWTESYQPNTTFYLPKNKREELHACGKRSRQIDPAGTYAHRIYNHLLIDLSYNSSRLEGNTYSLLETEKLILSGEDASGKFDSEKIMILNHKEAIRYMVDRAGEIVPSKKCIMTLHYLLSADLIDEEYSGKIRDHGVRIQGTAYHPYENPSILEELFDLITNKGREIEDPFEQSFFLLVHISYLQAFVDVNKRTARLSANIPLIKGNFVPLSFNDIDTKEYIDAMVSVYELNDINPLIDLYSHSYLRGCHLYDTTLEAVGFNEIRARYRKERRSIIREIVLKTMDNQRAEQYGKGQAALKIPESDRPIFLSDLLTDLSLLNDVRIAGLSVTLEEFQKWEKGYNKK